MSNEPCLAYSSLCSHVCVYVNFSLWRGGERGDFSSKLILPTYKYVLIYDGPVPINLHNVRELISLSRNEECPERMNSRSLKHNIIQSVPWVVVGSQKLSVIQKVFSKMP